MRETPTPFLFVLLFALRSDTLAHKLVADSGDHGSDMLPVVLSVSSGPRQHWRRFCWSPTPPSHPKPVVSMNSAYQNAATPTAPPEETVEISTSPGTLVVLRPDFVSHQHFAPGLLGKLAHCSLEQRVSKVRTRRDRCFCARFQHSSQRQCCRDELFLSAGDALTNGRQRLTSSIRKRAAGL